jgi:hypothetical protein
MLSCLTNERLADISVETKVPNYKQKNNKLNKQKLLEPTL